MTTAMTESPEPDPLAFTPVPTASTRRDGWTPERQQRFIAALAAMGSVAAAARAVGKSTTTAYQLRERPGAAEFARAWATAQAMAEDRQFAAAMDRALNGYLAPRYYAGEQVGVVRCYDYRLPLALLRRQAAAITARNITPAVPRCDEQTGLAPVSPASPLTRRRNDPPARPYCKGPARPGQYP